MIKSKKRNSNRCFSCKHLKIKCDGAKPACEYCAATGRKCCYEEPRPAEPKSQVVALARRTNDVVDVAWRHRPSSSSSSASLLSLDEADNESESDFFPGTFNSLRPMNDVQTQMKMALYRESAQYLQRMSESKSVNSFLYSRNLDVRQLVLQLGVTEFELKLLHVYNEFHERHLEHNRSSTLVHAHLSDLWHQSPLIRHNIYCMAILYLWDEYNFETSESTPVFKRLLMESVFEYSAKTIQSTNEVVTDLLKNNAKVDNKFQAAEIIITAVMTFTFFALQPFDILPLISFEPGSISLVSLIRALSVIMEDCFQAVFQSKFRNLLFLCEILGPPQLDGMYPVVQILHDALRLEKDALDVDKIFIYKSTLDQFNIGIYRAIEESQPSSIYRWIFIIRDEVVQYMYDKEYFALKLLYFFCCLALMSGLRISNKSNMLIDYCNWYKTYNEETYGNWYDHHDKAFYDLVIVKQYQTSSPNFEYLNKFDPATFEIET